MTANNDSGARYALISVSDKSGVAEFAAGLAELGFTLLSTGGTARLLSRDDLPVREVSQHTGFPEIMDGRVKTLHPRIHGGILGRDRDAEVMAEQDIVPIDIVAVNLYPFAEVTARPGCSLEDAIENIDIGGPAMVRAAAKNHARVTVVTRPADYDRVLSELRETGEISQATRFELATAAYAHTAHYDGMVADFLSRQVQADDDNRLPQIHSPQFHLGQTMRYGENPHQQAGFYRVEGDADNGLAAAEILQGKALSYNNIADADAALECVRQFQTRPACVIVKHANPCGAAMAENPLDAYDLAYTTDPVSAFGGIIAFNRPVDGATAAEIIARQFVEVVIAPAFDTAARDAFAAKPNVRLLSVAEDAGAPAHLNYHRVAGGLLVQEQDTRVVTREECACPTERQPTDAEWKDLLFAWKMARMVKSNAIVYAADQRTLGIGAGQMSRVDSSRIAAWKAGEAHLSLRGAAMASDAFFPFRDSIDTAAGAGIRSIIQPGGSMRDDEVIAAADEHGIAMVFTGVRHFRH